MVRVFLCTCTHPFYCTLDFWSKDHKSQKRKRQDKRRQKKRIVSILGKQVPYHIPVNLDLGLNPSTLTRNSGAHLR